MAFAGLTLIHVEAPLSLHAAGPESEMQSAYTGVLPAAPGYSESDLLHDRMDYGEHPEFSWHCNVVGWLSYLDGLVAGLPDSKFRSAIISGIQFDDSVDTSLVIARIDRNDLSKFCIGYTDIPPDFSDYNLAKVTYGIFIDSTGALSPSWDAGNEGYWSASLPQGLYDLRITVDRTTAEMTFDFDAVAAFDSSLSGFDPPVLSITESVDLADILHIQMNLYNQYSVVYDVWSTKKTPALLRIQHPRYMVVMENDTVAFETAADYDGEKDLEWYFEDPRFVRDGNILRWITGNGDCGLYTATLGVTDGWLVDTVTVWYAVTRVYESSLTHDRMNGLPGSPYGWIINDMIFWHMPLDGYLSGTNDISWTSAVVATREELLEETRSWVFRVVAGGGREYAIGLTEIPPARHDGRPGNLRLGLLIEGDGKVSPAWYSSSTQFEETTLADGIYDIRITWDPAIDEVRFEAVPVPEWVDSLSTFSEAVWTTWADAGLAAPVWVQINAIGGTPRVYDMWSYSPQDGPSWIVEKFEANLRPAEIELFWTVADHDETGEFVILRCPGVMEGCRELVRIPVIDGITVYGYEDEDVAPGSVHNYRVYLDRGLGMEMLFETGELEVPVMPASLFQNHPNPLNPGTTIGWYLPSASHVRITIYDVAGRSIRHLVDDEFEAGVNSTDWNGTRDSGEAAVSGVYFYRIEAGPFSDSKKMVLLR